ncbi:MAG: type II toxin-antitoxin system RelE/ParE family toxin [Alteromonadaceae bacterium]|nr:type II toxin-antitoxin system RelE/ParE family toxin [Alteromonadaceae bacterium]
MNKENSYRLIATPVFKLSLQRLSHFLTRKFNGQLAQKNKQQLKQKLMLLTKQPYIAPISERLLELGICDYRQWLVDEHNIVFYRIDEQENYQQTNKQQTKIILLLVMDSRQGMQKLLYDLLLIS